MPEARLRRDGHLTGFGEVVPQGAWTARRLAELVEAEDGALSATARATLQVLVDGLRHLDERIAELDAEIARRAREDALARRLMTIVRQCLSDRVWMAPLARALFGSGFLVGRGHEYGVSTAA